MMKHQQDGYLDIDALVFLKPLHNAEPLNRFCIKVNHPAKLNYADFSQTIFRQVYDNYFVDDVQIEGSRTWINNGLNVEGQWNFTRNIQGMKLSYPDGTSITWNRSNTVTLMAGGNTPNILIDDVWSSVGEASGTNRKGESFSAQIVKPLIKRNNCRWISEGVLTLTRGGVSGTLDYGAGVCDRFATLTTAGGETYTVRLRR